MKQNKDGRDRNKGEVIKQSKEAELQKNDEDLTIDTVDLITEIKNLECSEYNTRPTKLRPVKCLTRSRYDNCTYSITLLDFYCFSNVNNLSMIYIPAQILIKCRNISSTQGLRIVRLMC